MLRYILAFLIVLFPLLAHAAEPPRCTGKNLLDDLAKSDSKLHAKIMAEAKATPNAEAIFWRIEGKNGAEDSWLYGTAHLSDPRLTSLAPGAVEAIANASVVALELKEIAEPPQQLMMAMMMRARYLAMPLGQSLWAMIDDADEKIIKESPNFPAERAAAFDAYQPWVVASALTVPKCEQQRVAAGEMGVDRTIAQYAQVAGVEVIGLETIDEQLAVMSGMTMEMQVKYLVATAKAGAVIADYIETLVQLYVRRGLAALMPLSRASGAATGTDDLEIMGYVEKSLISKRNQLMRDRALALLAKGNAFIAVGALHLPGKDGLVELFRQAGYKVTPVN